MRATTLAAPSAFKGSIRNKHAFESAGPPAYHVSSVFLQTSLGRSSGSTWMWRNIDVAAMIEWMRKHNNASTSSQIAPAFYGLDLYNIHGSIAAVIEYLDDPAAAKVARERYGCLSLAAQAVILRPRSLTKG